MILQMHVLFTCSDRFHEGKNAYNEKWMSDIILHVQRHQLISLYYWYYYFLTSSVCLSLYSYLSVLFALNYSSLLQSHPCLTLMMQTVFQTL